MPIPIATMGDITTEKRSSARARSRSGEGTRAATSRTPTTIAAASKAGTPPGPARPSARRRVPAHARREVAHGVRDVGVGQVGLLEEREGVAAPEVLVGRAEDADRDRGVGLRDEV